MADAIADLPQGVIAKDKVGTNQNIAASGGTWYVVSSLSVTGTIVNGRNYAIDYAATLLSETSLLGLDLELRVGATFATGTPLDRDTTFAYAANRGLGCGGSAKVTGLTGSFEGSKTFQLGVRVSDDADIRIVSDTSGGGSNATLTLIDQGAA